MSSGANLKPPGNTDEEEKDRRASASRLVPIASLDVTSSNVCDIKKCIDGTDTHPQDMLQQKYDILQTLA